MRMNLKQLIATGLDRSGLLLFLRRYHASRAGIILTLHRVVRGGEQADPSDPRLVLHDSIFEELLLLLRQEFQPVSLHQLLRHPESTDGRQRVALTFDDGWEDTYSVAYPLLLRHRVPATVFLCTGLVGTRQTLPEDRFARLWRACMRREQTQLLTGDLRQWGASASVSQSYQDWVGHLNKLPMEAKLLMLSHLENTYAVAAPPERRFLSWEEAQEMTRNGITFGSHSIRHSTLTTEKREVVIQEMTGSREAIEDRLGIKVDYLAYPNGAYDQRVMYLAREAGYTHGFASSRGWMNRATDPMAIPRVVLDDARLMGRSSMLHASRTRLCLQPKPAIHRFVHLATNWACAAPGL